MANSNQPIKLSSDELLLMNIFEGITSVSPITCRMIEDIIFYIVHERDVYKMFINKPLVNDVSRYLKYNKYTPTKFVSALAKLLSDNLKKKVYIVIYNDDLISFIKNFFGLSREDSIRIMKRSDGSTIVYINVPPDKRGVVIGRGGLRAKIGRELAKAFFNVSNILIR